MNMVGSGTTDLVLLVRRFPVPDRDLLKGMECAPRQRTAVRAIKIKDRAANDFFFDIAQRGTRCLIAIQNSAIPGID